MKKWLWWTLWGRGMGLARRQLGRSHKEAQNPQNEHGKSAVVVDGLQRYLNGVGSSLADTSGCDVRGEAEKRTTNEHQSTRMKKWLWWTLWGRGMGFARRQLGRSHKMNMEKTLSWWMGCSGNSMVWDRPSLTLRVVIVWERLGSEPRMNTNRNE